MKRRPVWRRLPALFPRPRRAAKPLALAVLCLFVLAGRARAQNAWQQYGVQQFGASIQLRHVTIVSGDLPKAESLQISQALEGRTYPLMEIANLVRQNLRDAGYAQAGAEIEQLANLLADPPAQPIDLVVHVSAGAKYYIEQIRFADAAAFPAKRLRKQFPIEDGDLFNATAVDKGIDQLKKLYAARGFDHFAAMPELQYDDARHTVVVTIDVDEGERSQAGR